MACRPLLAEHRIQGSQAYGTADLMFIAYETEGREGLVIDDLRKYG
jgi:hypothetical protein